LGRLFFPFRLWIKNNDGILYPKTDLNGQNFHGAIKKMRPLFFYSLAHTAWPRWQKITTTQRIRFFTSVSILTPEKMIFYEMI